MFGSTSTGANTAFGGSLTPAAGLTTGGFAFGTSDPKRSSSLTGFSFGQASTPAQRPTTLTLPQPGHQASLSFSFGQTSTPNGSPFGRATAAAPQPAASSSMFGNASNTGTLFGNTNGSNNAPNGTTGNGTLGSLFGKPTAPSLFGAAAANGTSNTAGNTTSLFGNGASNTAGNTSSLFGNGGSNTAGNTSSLFGNGASNTAGNTTSLFGNPTAPANPPANPYTYGTEISSAKIDHMPSSLTAAPQAPVIAVGAHTKRKRQSVSEGTTRGSLLDRLGNTLRFFSGQKDEGQGLFTASSNRDVAHALEASNSTPQFGFNLGFGAATPQSTVKFQSSTLRKIYPERTYADSSDLKRLVIKHQPSRFDLIDANAVLKRRRVEYGGSNALVDSDDDMEATAAEETTAWQPEMEAAAARADKDAAATTAATTAASAATSATDSPSASGAPSASNGNSTYWCLPPIAELTAMTLDQLTNVENFIIGRTGYGTVRFNHPVDLSGLANLEQELFNNIVKFNAKNVQVYSNLPAHQKPPMGTALNIPATITIEKVFPKGTVAAFTKTLQQQRGMEFVTYDPSTGTWVFKVKHFSVWGIIDEEDVAVLRLKQKQDENEAEAESQYERLTRTGVYRGVSPDRSVGEIPVGKRQRVSGGHPTDVAGGHPTDVAGGHPTDVAGGHPSDVAGGHTGDFVPGGWRLDLEKLVASRDAQVQSEVAQKLREAQSAPSDGAPGLERSRTNSPPLEPEVDFELVHQLTTSDVQMDDLIDEKPYEPEVETVLHPEQPVTGDWSAQLERSAHVHSSLAKRTARAARAASAAGPKAMARIGMAEVDRLLFGHLEATVVEAEAPAKAPVKGELVDAATTGAKLQAMIAASTFLKRNNGFPKLRAQRTAFGSLAALHAARGSHDHFWRLCTTLFDPQPVDTALGPEAQARTALCHRRELLAEWVHDFNQPAVARMLLLASDPLSRVFAHLCARDLPQAVQTALEANYKHLAVMISLLGSDDPTAKYLAAQQLEYWHETAAEHHIPPGVLRVYQLLTGVVCGTLVAAGLEWSVALGLELYYGSVESVKDTLEGYLAATDLTGVDHVCLAALRLYVCRDDPAAVEVFLSRDAVPVELRWFVCVLGGVSANSGFTAITLEFGTLLQSAKLLPESVFVLAHLGSDAAAEAAITEVVMTEIEAIQTRHLEPVLVRTLHVPRRVVDEAIAARFRSFGDHWREASALLDAGDQVRAHRTVLENVAPAAVIAGGDRLKSLQALLERFSSPVQGWSSGVGVYGAYLALVLPSNSTDDDLPLQELLTNLPVLALSSPTVTVAANLMARAVVDRCLARGQYSGLQRLPLSASDRGYIGALTSTEDVMVN